jgi:hypothetical protein
MWVLSMDEETTTSEASMQLCIVVIPIFFLLATDWTAGVLFPARVWGISPHHHFRVSLGPTSLCTIGRPTENSFCGWSLEIVWWLVKNKLKGLAKERSWPILRYPQDIFLEGLRKLRKISTRRASLGRDLNMGYPEYEAEVPPHSTGLYLLPRISPRGLFRFKIS